MCMTYQVSADCRIQTRSSDPYVATDDRVSLQVYSSAKAALSRPSGSCPRSPDRQKNCDTRLYCAVLRKFGRPERAWVMGRNSCSKNTHQLSCRRDDQCPQPILRSPLPSIQYLENRNEERQSLATASPRSAEYIFSFHGHGQTFGLDIRHVHERGFLETCISP